MVRANIELGLNNKKIPTLASINCAESVGYMELERNFSDKDYVLLRNISHLYQLYLKILLI